MRTPTATILLAFIPLCLANWSPGKAAQMNFYKDSTCGAYVGEAAAFHNTFPEVGTIGSTTGVARAQCFSLNMPDNSQSINTVAMWGYSAVKEPGQWSGYCTFWDGYNCEGNAKSSYAPLSKIPSCMPGRSKDGWLWKSAKCYLS
ncbi:hypothetical protein R3P38DRAFT_2516544 [Favolaschia claudopus]|uniref:Uncharacterized protein n=1 Tax=Favolaschia claudopus TaxID=2862362 RepID=A0AAW0CKA9_9AGAR